VKIQVQLKSDQKKGTVHEDEMYILIISHSFPLRTRNISDKYCRQNQKRHFMFNNVFFKSCLVWDNVKKQNCRAGQARHDNMVDAHCMLDN
jgi:hypothetical protein